MSSVDWVPELAVALDELFPLDDGSRADWGNVVARAGKRRQLRVGRGRHSRLRLAIVAALLFLLLTGVATATYLIVRGDGDFGLPGSAALVVVNPNGPSLHTIAGCAPGRPSCMTIEQAWSPNATRVAFVRGRYGGPYRRSHMFLYVAAADGRGARRLAPCGLCGQQVGGYLAWSPDGRQIAFSRDSGVGGQQSLWAAATAGGSLRRLTHCSMCTDVEPAWSPNGELIVFTRFTRSARGLFTIRSNGSDLMRIVTGGAEPRWSPNGRRIAFDTNHGNSIEVANADGSHLTRIASGADPAWSPSGRKLVFFKTTGRPGRERAEVWTMNADGSSKERLYRSDCCIDFTAPPIWSPDGRMIAFAADSAGGTFVINADGSSLRRLSPLGFSELSWQPLPKGKQK